MKIMMLFCSANSFKGTAQQVLMRARCYAFNKGLPQESTCRNSPSTRWFLKTFFPIFFRKVFSSTKHRCLHFWPQSAPTCLPQLQAPYPCTHPLDHPVSKVVHPTEAPTFCMQGGHAIAGEFQWPHEGMSSSLHTWLWFHFLNIIWGGAEENKTISTAKCCWVSGAFKAQANNLRGEHLKLFCELKWVYWSNFICLFYEDQTTPGVVAIVASQIWPAHTQCWKIKFFKALRNACDCSDHLIFQMLALTQPMYQTLLP